MDAILDQEFDPIRVATCGHVFSDEVESDAWVMFHGTSGGNAEAIERDGFAPRAQTASINLVQQVVNVFVKLRWAGLNNGGYGVLKPYSLDYDFRDQRRSPIFFAETSLRALLYASRDFAGGEKLRALRVAISDLDTYLADETVRKQHEDAMSKEFRMLTELNAHPSMLEAAQPITVDLEWLSAEVKKLAITRQIAEGPQMHHDHGVVYAVRMTHNELVGMRWNSMMGIEADLDVSASKIIAKVIVPRNYEVSLFSTDVFEEVFRRSAGLVAALTAQMSE